MMPGTAAILDRLRTEQTLAENGNHPILARNLALAISEIERLLGEIKRIAEYPQGQVFSAGFAPADAENMQEIARAAIAKAAKD